MKWSEKKGRGVLSYDFNYLRDERSSISFSGNSYWDEKGDFLETERGGEGGKCSLRKREVVRGLCTALWAKRKEICALLSLRVTNAPRRREM